MSTLLDTQCPNFDVVSKLRPLKAMKTNSEELSAPLSRFNLDSGALMGEAVLENSLHHTWKPSFQVWCNLRGFRKGLAFVFLRFFRFFSASVSSVISYKLVVIS